jgi:hypothetical protein
MIHHCRRVVYGTRRSPFGVCASSPRQADSWSPSIERSGWAGTAGLFAELKLGLTL